MKTILHSVIALTILSLAACSSSPTASKTRSEMEAGTKTGMVKNIVVKDTITPDSLTVRAGDEVRWINQRQESVVVTVDGPLEHNVSCRNGFSKALGMGVDNSTTLASNETAGLCFTRVGTVNYSVRPSSEDKSGPARTQGSINVQ
jgi:plastocyanin